MDFSKICKKELNINIGIKDLFLMVESVEGENITFTLSNILQQDIIKSCLEKGYKTVSFLINDETSNEVLKMECEIKEVNSVNLICTSPKVVSTIQRRKYNRLPITLNASFIVIKDEEIKDSVNENNLNVQYKPIILKTYKKQNISAKTVDISMGGVQIYSDKVCSEGDVIFLQLSKLFFNVEFIGKVVRVQRKDKGYNVGISILIIDKENLEKLNNFIDKKEKK